MRYFAVNKYIEFSILIVILAVIVPSLFVQNFTKASSTTFTVTKTADTNDGSCNADCSLREAVAAANANVGADTINFNIPESDGGYIPPAGDVQGYFLLSTNANYILSDTAGVFINGYSQAGASRNTAAFGETLNTVLKIRVSITGGPLFTINVGNNHLAGLNMGSSTSGGMQFTASSNNWIEGNFIATNISGSTSSAFGTTTVQTGSTANIFGTNGDGVNDNGERNLIQMWGTNQSGGAFQFVAAADSDNIVSGNYFGVDKTSRTCGTGGMYRYFLQANGDRTRIGTNLDGVSDTEESNIFACININKRTLVRISGSDGIIQGNYFGTNAFNDDLQSSFVEPGVTDNGVATGWTIARNTFAHLSDAAIALQNGNSKWNRFSQNSIHNVTGTPIDLVYGTATPNDAGDIDTSYNDRMNYPVITKMGLSSDGKLLVKANLDFKADEAPYTLEFFNNTTIHSSGRGPGETFIGSVTTTEIGNDIALAVPITGATPTAIDKITATATNTLGSTSEFSAVAADPVSYAAFASGGIDIADGANSTPTRVVTLTLSSISNFGEVSQMQISNDASFSGVEWEDFVTTKSWTLGDGNGAKTVYVKYKDAIGQISDTYSKTINLEVVSASSSSDATQTTSDVVQSTSSNSLAALTLVKLGTINFNSKYNRYYYTGHRPKFTGIAPPNAKVTVTIQSDPITCTTTADGNGNWSCTPTTDIPNGDHTVTIQSVGTDGQYALASFKLGINIGLAATGDDVMHISQILSLLLIAITILLFRTKYEKIKTN
jgi:CSLREA domain-containing protein